MLEQIEQIINKHIRPSLAAHGGDIQIVKLTDDNILKIKLLGTCATCPAQQQTIESLVANVLQEQIPQIKSVLLTQEVSDELLQQALHIIRGKSKT